MAGPFDTVPLNNLRISPLGLVPKKEPGTFRLIHHLSYPKGHSVNDGIDQELSSVSYASVKQAVRLVRRAGRGALLAKVDIKSAFRLLPIHPVSQQLLGCAILGKFFVDLCLPMGCSISCSFFEKFSTFLHWVLSIKTGLHSVVHYLDDFLFVGPADSADCLRLMQGFKDLAEEFGIPLAVDKSEGPCQVLSFLGIEVDTMRMECRLPLDKVVDLCDTVGKVLLAKKVTLRVMQSLLGTPLQLWIVGHSFIYWARRAAAITDRGRQLGFPEEALLIKWFGIRGMRWEQVLEKLWAGVRHHLRAELISG
ncbi:uncharacterized protein O3C94_004897 [Discoglossus pictus]